MSTDRCNDNDDKIVEDTPRMRSVSMMAAPPSLILREAPSPVKRHDSAPQRLVATVKTPSAVPAEEAWASPSLESVPLYYQLERSHAKVADDPAVVAQRITDCLREQSMGAVYHENETCVDVETCDNVTFSVRLWKADEEKQVIVEIQRTSGCCFLFHQACKLVLCAAKGEQIAKPSGFALPKCIPQETEAERLSCLKDSLDICSCLLKDQRVDAHLMALESLVKLSQCCRSRDFAARCILGSGEFLQTLVSLIQSSSCLSSHSDDGSEKEHLVLMHRLAMTILANCLSSLQEQNKDKSESVLQGDLTSDTTLLALIDRVAQCNKQPHDAFQAVRCLQELVGLKNSDCKQRALALGLANHANFAQQMGDRRHLQLHTESQKLLHQLKD